MSIFDKYLKYKTLGLVFLILLATFGLFFYIFYDFQKHRLEGLKKQYNEKIENFHNKNIQEYITEQYREVAYNFLNKEILASLSSQNKEDLLELTHSKYQKIINNDPNIKEMNFYVHQDAAFLQLHNLTYSSNNYLNQRGMIITAFMNKKEIAGYEVGEKGVLYRIVIPLFYQNEYIGLFEIGISLQKVLDYITHFNNVEGLVYLENKERVLISDNLRDKEFVKILLEFNNFVGMIDFKYKNKNNTLHFINIISFSEDYLGEFIFVQDLTKAYEAFNEAIQKMVWICLGMLVVLYFVIIYLIIFQREL